MRVLFLCTANSCRSILAEAIFNHAAPPGVQAFSAGSQPAGFVNPKTLALLGRRGISTAGLRSKSWGELGDLPFDIVITVCDNAAGEACPLFLGRAMKAHWGMPDPAHATGTTEEVDRAFEMVFDELSRRIQELLHTIQTGATAEQLLATLKALETK